MQDRDSSYSIPEDPSGESPRGMSDEEELKRWAEMYGEAQPLGEVIVDLGEDPDLAELGLTES